MLFIVVGCQQAYIQSPVIDPLTGQPIMIPAEQPLFTGLPSVPVSEGAVVGPAGSTTPSQFFGLPSSNDQGDSLFLSPEIGPVFDSTDQTGPLSQAPQLLPNPISIPVTNQDYVWEQIADVVSSYFKIRRERRVKREDNVLTEGIIETVPRIGATLFEPHLKDSVGRYNRWESTFQTIRRHAQIRVVPEAVGYKIEVIVQKELEDLPRPEHATAGTSTLRNDNSLVTARLSEKVDAMRTSAHWIPLGRDAGLEQRILQNIQSRLMIIPRRNQLGY